MRASQISDGRILDKRNGLTLFEVNYACAIDLQEVAALACAAWQLDYKGEMRFIYDEHYFRWLLGGADWTGYLIRADNTNELVACLFSLYRSIRLGDEVFPAVYSSALSVSPQHRRKGIAKWIYDVAEETRFTDSRGTSIEFAALQVGHAGLSTDRTSAAPSQHVDNIYLQSSQIWSKRLAGSQLLEEPGATADRFRVIRANRNADSSADNCSSCLHKLCVAIAATSVAFETSESFARLYLDSHSDRSGMLCYEMSDGGACALTYSIIDAAIDAAKIGKIAQIQTIQANCSPAQLESAFRHFCDALREFHCLAISIVDLGCIATAMLERADFFRSPAQATFKLRGPNHVIAKFKHVAPPYIVDFL